MKEELFLSIITINYNNAEGLKKTLESVKRQSSKNYEHIIIDGGSTDDSINILKQYLSEDAFSRQVTFWCSEKDNGVFNAMNKGISHAKGKYCNFLNSGDFFADDDVIRRFSELNLTEDIIYTNAIYFNSKEEWLLTYPDPLTMDFYLNDDGNLNHQNTLIKTTLQKKHLYLENYKINSDGEFFMSCLLNENVSWRYIRDTIAKYEFETGVSTLNCNLYRVERKKIIESLFSKSMIIDALFCKQEDCWNLQKKCDELKNDYDDYNECYMGVLRRLRKLLRFIRGIVKSPNTSSRIPKK